jgi:EAL domain-containing protein (putative c-di-GMP-specific phosphodiesterase class I)
MYRAKWDGKNRHVVFETGMQGMVQNRMELEMDLREALEKDEFFLVYQPTFDLRDMSPTGVEALIRWNSPTRGVVQPDDFGTGYSSLAHLQRFPVDALKIDRSFILGLEHNQEGETLIRTLVQLGKSLSIETFAEGIEQQQELSLLRGENCDSGQGFLFARPLDVAATEAFLQNWAENTTPALAQTPQHS